MEDNGFARMMEMEGVRPLGTPRATRRGSQPAAKPTGAAAATTPRPLPAAPTHAWASGSSARIALEVALRRTREGDGTEFATAMLADGSTRPLPALQGAAALLAAADRMDARLVVLGGASWTFVMHPSMGIATLDQNPERE